MRFWQMESAALLTAFRAMECGGVESVFGDSSRLVRPGLELVMLS
jgi:hypothetical protein